MRRNAQESQRNRKDYKQDTPARKRSGVRLIEGPPDEEPKASPQLTPAERRIREKLDAHWHEPDPWDGPIDSTTSGRSPP